MAKSFKSGMKMMKWTKVVIFLVAAFIFFFVVWWMSKCVMQNNFRAFEPFEGGAEGKPAKTDAKTTTPPVVLTTPSKESFVDTKKKEGFDPAVLAKKFEKK